MGDIVIGHLSIGETGCVKGAITAASIEVRGRVVGSITARMVRLVATARVEGDMTLEHFEAEKGASFEGRCMKLRTAPADEALNVAMESEPDFEDAAAG